MCAVISLVSIVFDLAGGMCELSEACGSLVLVESLVRGVSVVQLVFGLSNPRQSANFPLVKPKIRARIGQNVCPIRGEFAAGERFHQGQVSLNSRASEEQAAGTVALSPSLRAESPGPAAARTLLGVPGRKW